MKAVGGGGWWWWWELVVDGGDNASLTNGGVRRIMWDGGAMVPKGGWADQQG